MMKRLLIATALVTFCGVAIVCLQFGLKRPDPLDVVFRRLLGFVPISSITYAKQTGFGREPTFIGLVLADGVTNWPTMFRDLGCSPATDASKQAHVEELVFRKFKSCPVSPESIPPDGFAVWTGSLNGSPYYLSALVSRTNAFIVLDRY